MATGGDTSTSGGVPAQPSDCLYEGKLSFRFEAENEADARKITREIGDLGLQHPLAIDVAEEETSLV